MEELKNKIKEESKKEVAHFDDDFVPDDVAGGNVDDAYWAGVSSGRAELAKELVKLVE